MRRKIIFWICFVILLAAVGTGAGLLIRNHIQNQKDEDLRKKATAKTETTEDLSAEEETTQLQIPVDFNELDVYKRQNMAVQCALLQPGDTVMGMNLDHGGHLTHGSPVNFSGTYFHIVPYGVNDEGFIDYDKVEEIAMECKPKMIIAGASA